MSWFDGELPEPETPFDEKVLSDVRQYGWHCLHVSKGAHPEHESRAAAVGSLPEDIPFAYTIGVWLTLNHAEIILVGAWSSWHGILGKVVELIKQGRRFEPGEQTDDVLDDYPVRFGAVSKRNRVELLTFADWASHRRGFEAVQLILPDGNTHWPDDAQYASFDQPLLA